MTAVTKRLGSGGSTATKEDPALAGNIVKIAVSVTQIELAQISSQEIGTILGCDHFDCHEILLSNLASAVSVTSAFR
jgi:hypothetical protein